MSIKSVKKIIILALLITVLLPTVSFATHEKNCWICFENSLEWFVGAIASLIQMLSAALTSIAASFIGVLINATKNITSNPLVEAGFGIALSVANLGFVLAIIVIAFATILRLQNYAMKQILWKLVAAALLVNFSFAIAGIVIDFNNILGNFFLSGAGDIKNISQDIANSLNAQKLSGITSTGEGGFVNAIIGVVLPSVAVIIFNVLLVITFFALAVMLLIRYLYLLVLLILMPLAWLFWIFPNLSHLTGKWWDKFLHWNFFYPAVSFFIYLTIQTSKKMGDIVSEAAGGNLTINTPTESGAVILGVSSGTIVLFLQILVQSGMIFGGLMAAQAMGIASTSAVLGAAKGTARFAVGTIGKGGRLAGRGVGALGGTRLAQAGARKMANTLTGTWLRKIPGAERAAAGLSAFGSRKQAAEDYKKNILDKLEGTALDNVLSAPLSGVPEENTARLQKAAEIKNVGLMTEGRSEKEIMKLASHVKATNPKLVKEIIDNNPELAGLLSSETDPVKINAEITKATTAVSAGRVSEMATKALRNKVVASAFTEPLISGLVRTGSEEKLKALEQGLEEAAGLGTLARQQLRAGLKTVEERAVNLRKKIKEDEETAGTPAAKAQVNALKTQLATLRTNINNTLQQMQLSPEERKAYDKLQTLRQRIGNP